MKFFFSVIIIVLTANLPSFAGSDFPELAKIESLKVLESTRDDVKKLFDGENPAWSGDQYEADELVIFFSYSNGDCENGGWDTAKNRLTEINVVFLSTNKTDLLQKRWKKLGRLVTDDGFIYFDHSKGISYDVDSGLVQNLKIMPGRLRWPELCDFETLNATGSVESYIMESVAERNFFVRHVDPLASVTDVILSNARVFWNCQPEESQRYECKTKIFVKTLVERRPFEVVTYNYEVSGGKIIGRGAEVIWDLTGVPPGIYTITAGVDNGDGVGDRTKTETLTVADRKLEDDK